MSDTNRVSIALIVETALGVVPSSPTVETLRYTGTPNLAYVPQTVASAEIRDDRQVSDLVLVGAEAGGDAGFELSVEAVDRLLAAALFGVAGSASFQRQPFRELGNVGAVSTNSVALTDTSGAGGGAFVINDLVLFSGFALAANNGLFPALASTSATVINATGLVAEADPPNATVRVIRVGRLGASGDITATLTSGPALLSTVLDFTTLGLSVGDWIKVGDGAAVARSFATLTNNTFVRVSAIAAHRLDLDNCPSWGVDAGASKTIALFFGDRLRNGTTRTSFAVERRFRDHSPETVEVFTGMCVNTLALQIRAKSIITGSAGLMGLNATVAEATDGPGNDYSNIYSGTVLRVAAPTNPVLNASSNVGHIRRGGATLTGPNYVLEATVAINNNLRRQDAVGSLGSVGIGVGEFTLTGTLNTYFGNKSLLDQVLANTGTSFDFSTRDANGRGYVFDLPRIKFASGAPDVPGKNADVVINLGYQAIMHETLGYTMQVQRFHYAK